MLLSLLPGLVSPLAAVLGLLPGLASPLAAVLGLLVHLASLLRRRQPLLLPDRRGEDLTALLFPQILYRRIMLPRGLDILPRVAFGRTICHYSGGGYCYPNINLRGGVI